MKNSNIIKRISIISLGVAFLLSGCSKDFSNVAGEIVSEALTNAITYSIDEAMLNRSENINPSGNDTTDLGIYTTEPVNGAYIEINNNIPYFTDDEILHGAEPFEIYSELDEYGRCGVAYANICKEIMPTEERGEIGSIKPSGWKQKKYPELIEGAGYLYNRCHLIAFELAGENANEKQLITGTRYFNVTGMLPFENRVAEYVKHTGNHVLYRVTPDFQGKELVARGITIEAKSIEDDGCVFCVYIPNKQPGISINYATGESEKNS